MKQQNDAVSVLIYLTLPPLPRGFELSLVSGTLVQKRKGTDVPSQEVNSFNEESNVTQKLQKSRGAPSPQSLRSDEKGAPLVGWFHLRLLSWGRCYRAKKSSKDWPEGGERKAGSLDSQPLNN